MPWRFLWCLPRRVCRDVFCDVCLDVYAVTFSVMYDLCLCVFYDIRFMFWRLYASTFSFFCHVCSVRFLWRFFHNVYCDFKVFFKALRLQTRHFSMLSLNTLITIIDMFMYTILIFHIELRPHFLPIVQYSNFPLFILFPVSCLLTHKPWSFWHTAVKIEFCGILRYFQKFLPKLKKWKLTV